MNQAADSYYGEQRAYNERQQALLEELNTGMKNHCQMLEQVVQTRDLTGMSNLVTTVKEMSVKLGECLAMCPKAPPKDSQGVSSEEMASYGGTEGDKEEISKEAKDKGDDTEQPAPKKDVKQPYVSPKAAGKK